MLFSTKATLAYTDFAFADGDILLFGRESAGVPDHVHDAADEELLIPMPGGGRSLNVALAAAMAAGEAMRQLARNASSMPNAAMKARRSSSGSSPSLWASTYWVAIFSGPWPYPSIAGWAARAPNWTLTSDEHGVQARELESPL